MYITLEFQHNITPSWQRAFLNMGGHEFLQGASPKNFRFRKNKGSVHVNASSIQKVVDLFKQWLPNANRAYQQSLRVKNNVLKSPNAKGSKRKRHVKKPVANVLRNLKIYIPKPVWCSQSQ